MFRTLNVKVLGKNKENIPITLNRERILDASAGQPISKVLQKQWLQNF